MRPTNSNTHGIGPHSFAKARPLACGACSRAAIWHHVQQDTDQLGSASAVKLGESGHFATHFLVYVESICMPYGYSHCCARAAYRSLRATNPCGTVIITPASYQATSAPGVYTIEYNPATKGGPQITKQSQLQTAKAITDLMSEVTLTQVDPANGAAGVRGAPLSVRRN